MGTSFNRALQVRIADRLRANLSRDEAIDLPVADALSDVEQRALCEAGGGRLALVAIRVDGEAAVVRSVGEAIAGQLRRTDILACCVSLDRLLVVLAPGLDPTAGRSLADRLHDLLDELHVAGATIAVAFRSAASPTGWTVAALAAEAERNGPSPVLAAS